MDYTGEVKSDALKLTPNFTETHPSVQMLLMVYLREYDNAVYFGSVY